LNELQDQYETKNKEFEKSSGDALACLPSVINEIGHISTESIKVQKQIERFYSSLSKVL